MILLKSENNITIIDTRLLNYNNKIHCVLDRYNKISVTVLTKLHLYLS